VKNLLITLLKIGISAAIIAWLVVAARNDNAFGDLRGQYEDPGFAWGLLAAACLCCGAAVVITIVRWYYLVRALDMQFTLKETFRVGFLGYLFNLAPMGIVGGDLLKAVMLARQQPRRRAQSFATVAVDRVIGLYMLFAVASATILLTGFWRHEMTEIRFVCLATLATTLVATAALAMLFIPGVTNGRLSRWLGGLPRVGHPIEHLIDALRMYRRKPGVLLASAAMSAAVHSLFAVGIYLITRGIYVDNVGGLSLQGEFIVSPLSAATGVIPLVMGPMEAVLDFLYANVFGLDKRQGFVVALGYRLVTVLIAMVGVCYYLSARREVAQVMHEAEEADHNAADTPSQAVAGKPAAASR
jgi:uncharacterized protein (TIRG00374 family)